MSELKEITVEKAMAILGCEINCGWHREGTNCDFYTEDQMVKMVKRKLKGPTNPFTCDDGIIETSKSEAINIIKQ